jgi:hypothetical protein
LDILWAAETFALTLRKLQQLQILRRVNSRQWKMSARSCRCAATIGDMYRISAPLRDIANGSRVPSEPSKKVMDSSQKLKHYLTLPPILCYPDWNANFEIHTNAFKDGLGAFCLARIRLVIKSLK